MITLCALLRTGWIRDIHNYGTLITSLAVALLQALVWRSMSVCASWRDCSRDCCSSRDWDSWFCNCFTNPSCWRELLGQWVSNNLIGVCVCVSHTTLISCSQLFSREVSACLHWAAPSLSSLLVRAVLTSFNCFMALFKSLLVSSTRHCLWQLTYLSFLLSTTACFTAVKWCYAIKCVRKWRARYNRLD